MEKVHVDIHENVLETIKKIKSIKDLVVELHIPQNSVLFENSLNLKLLQKEAAMVNKELIFKTSDPSGINIINSISGDDDSTGSDFVSREVSIASVLDVSDKKSTRKLALPMLPKMPNLSLPNISFSNKAPMILGIVFAFGLFAFGIYSFLWRVPKANISVVVTSQPLIKSIEISVKPDTSSNVEAKILSGYLVQASSTDTASLVPTGQKIVGKKAQGKIKIINRTTQDHEFEKGEKVFAEDDDDLFYLLDDDVNVPKASLQDPNDVSSPLIPGSAEVDVTAEDIGKDYNISEGDDLEFDDYDSSDYVAEVVSDIKGGESKTVKIVAKEDLTKLSADLLKKTTEGASVALTKSLSSDQTLIDGSASATLTKDEFSAKLGDETDELKLIQTVSFQGLAYKKQDLNVILKGMLQGFVPEGFMLLDSELDTKVEILGNSDSTVLSTAEADLQVTIKSFVIPQIDEQELKQKLVGLSLSDAEKILGKVRNIKTYEIKIEPNVPLIRKLPSNIENISLTIKKD